MRFERRDYVKKGENGKKMKGDYLSWKGEKSDDRQNSGVREKLSNTNMTLQGDSVKMTQNGITTERSDINGKRAMGWTESQRMRKGKQMKGDRGRTHSPFKIMEVCMGLRGLSLLPQPPVSWINTAHNSGGYDQKTHRSMIQVTEVKKTAAVQPTKFTGSSLIQDKEIMPTCTRRMCPVTSVMFQPASAHHQGSVTPLLSRSGGWTRLGMLGKLARAPILRRN